MSQEHTLQSSHLYPRKWALDLFDVRAKVKPLPSYEDINFRLTDDQGVHYLMKVAATGTPLAQVKAQNQILKFLSKHSSQAHCFPAIIKGLNKKDWQMVHIQGQKRYLRLLTFLEGTFLHAAAPRKPLLYNFGQFLGMLDACLHEIPLQTVAGAITPWDLQFALDSKKYINSIRDPHYRRLAHYFLQQYQYEVLPRYPQLPRGIIHGDANDHNVLVKKQQICGLIDFGDATYSYRIHELAIALSYVLMRGPDILEIAGTMVSGYHKMWPLSSLELELLYFLISARLSVSLIMTSHQGAKDPQNEYLVVHQPKVKSLMDTMLTVNPRKFENRMKEACKLPLAQGHPLQKQREKRALHISPSLSLSYQNPLYIYRGAMQYLYEEDGTTFLDGVNNICHVGHCHPKVVEAATRQWSRLNTNTRYLYPQLHEYADQLCGLLPDSLSVVFFVNSGSEANDLALRIARTHTGHRDMVVIEGGYHGNTTASLEISSYKYQGPGGHGPEEYIHQLAMPDLFRGKYRAGHVDPLGAYLEEAGQLVKKIVDIRGGIAGFIAESLMGCGGQIELPSGYLSSIYELIRSTGGLCIADEVQVGFGRMGSHFWGFETQDVLPDIVTMGKPMGNGHPLAAVVTTKEIAASFDTGMEYFNSFGGNPVSCEVGKTVLQIIEEEQLQANAMKLGNKILSGLEELSQSFHCIGEVRGRGLFLGLELIKDPDTLEPAAESANLVVEEMKANGILLSTDGPFHNVIKFKPPMVFNQQNVEFLLEKLAATFRKITSAEL